MRKQRYSGRPWDEGRSWPLAKIHAYEKQRVRSKVILRIVVERLKRRWKLNKRRWGWRLAWWGSTVKKKISYLLRWRGRHHYSDQHSSRTRAPCVASTAAGTGGKRTKLLICQQKESSSLQLLKCISCAFSGVRRGLLCTRPPPQKDVECQFQWLCL